MNKKLLLILTVTSIFVIQLLSINLITSNTDKYLRWIKETELKEEEDILRKVFVSRSLNLKHFPPGIYIYQKGLSGEVIFSNDNEPLINVYKKKKFNGNYLPAIKFMIRENGKFDITTQGIIKNGVNSNEKQLIAGRICTSINENPYLKLENKDSDKNRVIKHIFMAMRAAITFKEEKIALLKEIDFPPLPIIEENNRIYSEQGNLKIFFKKNNNEYYIEGYRTTGTIENFLKSQLKKGKFIDTINLKRAMVHESVVGTVIPWEINGFAEKIKLLIGIDNNEKITGIHSEKNRKTTGISSKMLQNNGKFLKQFEGLLINDIGFKHNSTGIIDSRTGATISAQSIVRAIKSCLIFNEKLNMEEYGQDTP